MTFSRRNFLKQTLAAALPAALPEALRRQAGAPAQLNAASLTPFVDALPIPPRARPVGTRPDPNDAGAALPYYRIEMREFFARLHRDLPPARLWGFGGTFPGPTIETRSGTGLWVEWSNALPAKHFLPVDRTLEGAAGTPEVRAVAHLHGGRTPPESDGYPEHWIVPGQSALYHYPNRQEGAMLWYHDHAMGINRLNIYAGLFGAWFVRDAVEDGLGLPADEFELPLIVCDRLFYENGQLLYPASPTPQHPWVPEVYGDVMLVNGKALPFHEVAPRQYRLRVLNGSNARFFNFSFSNGQEFLLIGVDQGLLDAPLRRRLVTVAPGERVDLLADFAPAAGEQVVLRSGPIDILQFRVGAGAGAAARTPERLRALARPDASAAEKVRQLSLNDYADDHGVSMMALLNATRWNHAVTETPALDSTEIWSFVNLTDDVHPIHLHLVRFRILDRCRFDAWEFSQTGQLRLTDAPIPADASEAGWKDTVRADPGMVTRILVKFEGYAGRYVWHCHILEHEDNEMMRPYEIVRR